MMDGEAEDGTEGYFGGWFLENDAYPCASCDQGFIGYKEDIEAGQMPTHWIPLPAAPVADATENRR